MKFVSEKKTQKPYKLPFESPVPLAWVAYVCLTLLSILFALPIGAISRDSIIPLLIIIGVIIIIVVGVVFAFLSIHNSRYSKDHDRVRFAFRLLIVSGVSILVSFGGGLLIGRNPSTAYLAQICVLLINASIITPSAIKFRKKNLDAPKLRKTPEKLPKDLSILFKFVIFPILALLIIYSALMILTIVSGNFR